MIERLYDAVSLVPEVHNIWLIFGAFTLFPTVHGSGAECVYYKELEMNPKQVNAKKTNPCNKRLDMFIKGMFLHSVLLLLFFFTRLTM